ncbi:MAG: nucleoside triphosphate pyrophosphohydrolase [Spirochaetes bacterium]|nr:MAG: nucleoside triphosphate pyrophosphohydrolase [Spirochaetota bacterium]RKX90407.1 MAG: nucleoside triphosphate pyrophosphohydrolase [Spirochaetota bacterium]RKX98080.1 MAG: nucleoside triphosphate pyrophosphohydrolase [Spirochaetota bacterium]
MNKADSDENNQAFMDFLGIITTLRGPDGCPWDKEQTAESLRAHLIEESYEAVEAIEENDPDHVREELGDVLLLISMISQIYSETDDFTIKDVIDEISAKLIRRHPHVFGDEKVEDAEEVLKNWDRIKIDIEGRGADSSVLDGIPGSLPPLERSYKIQKKAAKRGFDWPDINGPKDKIIEELNEIEIAVEEESPEDIEGEIGDLLFSVVNYSRHLGIDPALALGRTNRKFEKRFKYVESSMQKDSIPMNPENIEVMDRYWDSSKKETQSHT